MSVTDIRISTQFFSDIKIMRLTALCGSDGVIGLQKLWIFAAQHKPDGALSDVTDKEIPLITGVQSPEYLNVLIDLDLLARNADGTLFIVNWGKHQSWVVGAPERSESARKAAAARWKKRINSGLKNVQGNQ